MWQMMTQDNDAQSPFPLNEDDFEQIRQVALEEFTNKEYARAAALFEALSLLGQLTIPLRMTHAICLAELGDSRAAIAINESPG